MRIIPVIDLIGGAVVRAVGGRRDDYRPLVSRLYPDSHPLALARAMLAQTAARELYVADLDAFRGDGVVSRTARDFVADIGQRVWLDVGVRGFGEAAAVAGLAGFVKPIVASETIREEPRPGGDLVNLWANAAFSLDLSHGRVRAGWHPAATPQPLELARTIEALGCRSFVVLDVAAVGERQGPATLELCRRLRSALPGIELISGGGIRHRDDVRRFQDAGCNAVLVSTAIHEGTLTFTD